MLHVHRSDRADGLIEALRGLFAEPPPDPFAREVIAVPTRGMERWLTQRLSNALGICANVDFPFPRTVVGNAVAAASGIDPATDPWLPERMVWPLLEVVDQAHAEPWMRPNSLLGWNAAITPYAVSAIAPSATNATPLCSLMPSHTR